MGRIMTGQFIVALVLFGLAVGFTANLWLTALQRTRFREIANFYRLGFLGLALSMACLVWVQVFSLIDTRIGEAALNGISAMLVLFVLFAWGRLTLIGLKFDATHVSKSLPA
jgi:hypothetical protein